MKNTDPKTPEQTPDTGNVSQRPTRATRNRRRLTLVDARAVAKLCAKRASEREACALLGIPYSTWAHYKSKNRNGEAFSQIVDAIKGAKIDAHMDNIEAFSKKDWRASECYLEKTIPDRFSTKGGMETAGTVVVVDESKLKRIQEICERTRQQMLADAGTKPALAMLPAPPVVDVTPAAVPAAELEDWPPGKD